METLSPHPPYEGGTPLSERDLNEPDRTQAAPAKKEAEPRPYVVLRHETGSGEEPGEATFVLVGLAPALSARAAIKGLASETGSYVAVPERSFQIVGVRHETETVVRFND